MAEQTQTLAPAVSATSHKPRLWASKEFQENFYAVLATLIAIMGLLIVLFPIFWMLSTSLKGQIEALKMPPNWIPAEIQWNNYYDALTVNPFGLYFWNTFKFAVLVMLGETISCAFIAYGFAIGLVDRQDFRNEDAHIHTVFFDQGGQVGDQAPVPVTGETVATPVG